MQKPLAMTRNAQAPTGEDHGTMPTTDLDFEAVAQEKIAVVTNNSYEVHAYQNPDFIPNQNFGTIDNPHAIFTNDIPFRFVGCTGHPNEDDFEGHEIMYFLLREGSMQRCMGCGQVFKLVRLRPRNTAENDYYVSGMFPAESRELGEADHWMQQSPLRQMPHSYEHTNFETKNDQMYSLINPDEHDQYLTDPAKRLERTKMQQDVHRMLNEENEKLGTILGNDSLNGKVQLSKRQYENLVEAELAINDLNRYHREIQKFNFRSILDPKNHERREQRMVEQAKCRMQNYHSIYLNSASEKELQFRDYFETDLELENEKGTRDWEISKTKADAMGQNNMRIENIDFTEENNENQPDVSGLIERKVFKYRFRQAHSNNVEHERRETRMISRMTDPAELIKIHQKVQ